MGFRPQSENATYQDLACHYGYGLRKCATSVNLT